MINITRIESLDTILTRGTTQSLEIDIVGIGVTLGLFVERYDKIRLRVIVTHHPFTNQRLMRKRS
jgi:hypothetical protein